MPSSVLLAVPRGIGRWRSWLFPPPNGNINCDEHSLSCHRPVSLVVQIRAVVSVIQVAVEREGSGLPILVLVLR